MPACNQKRWLVKAPWTKRTAGRPSRYARKRCSARSTPSGVETRRAPPVIRTAPPAATNEDRKSTRLNSSHGYISYAVFCLKKKKKTHSKHTPDSTPQSSSHLAAQHSRLAQIEDRPLETAIMPLRAHKLSAQTTRAVTPRQI